MLQTEHWLKILFRLRVDRSTGDPAPHKPLLLLVLLDLADAERLPQDVLALTADLSFRFATYWSVVAQRRSQRPDVRLPFHHLSSDGLWTALTAEGVPSTSSRTTRLAQMDPSFSAFLRCAETRQEARQILIGQYFQPDERIALCAMMGIECFGGVTTDGGDATKQGEAVEKGRVGRFRIQVVDAYGYACALTGHRLTTIEAGSLVEAAHIHQFAISGNNDITNGVALNRNAHWLFDAGLWTLSDDYKVMVAVGEFDEQSPEGKPLRSYHGHSLRLPRDSRCWPNILHIRWHRTHRFRG